MALDKKSVIAQGDIDMEGVDWRLWDRKPTNEQRRDTPWNGPAWHDARAMGTIAAAGNGDDRCGGDLFRPACGKLLGRRRR